MKKTLLAAILMFSSPALALNSAAEPNWRVSASGGPTAHPIEFFGSLFFGEVHSSKRELRLQHSLSDSYAVFVSQRWMRRFVKVSKPEGASRYYRFNSTDSLIGVTRTWHCGLHFAINASIGAGLADGELRYILYRDSYRDPEDFDTFHFATANTKTAMIGLGIEFRPWKTRRWSLLWDLDVNPIFEVNTKDVLAKSEFIPGRGGHSFVSLGAGFHL